MEKILIVSGTEKSSTILKEMLSQMDFPDPYMVQSEEQAKIYLETGRFDLVIINTPLPDGFGLELLRLTRTHARCNVVLLVKQEQVDSVWEKIKNEYAMIVPKPFKHAVLMQTLSVIRQGHMQMDAVEESYRALQDKMRETNLLNRAKLVLMQVLKMTESQAHRYLEKQAMDMRVSKREIAEGIIKTYDH